MTVEETIKDRDSVHGDYSTQAAIFSKIVDAFNAIPVEGENFSPEAHEAMIMIAIKLARIIAGDANYKDHWHDIAGYAMLVEQRLLGKNDQHTKS